MLYDEDGLGGVALLFQAVLSLRELCGCEDSCHMTRRILAETPNHSTRSDGRIQALHGLPDLKSMSDRDLGSPCYYDSRFYVGILNTSQYQASSAICYM